MDTVAYVARKCVRRRTCVGGDVEGARLGVRSGEVGRDDALGAPARPAPWIAEEAAVSPNTARDHLRRLIELGVVTTTERDGTRHYYPDPLYTRLRDVRELLEDTTKQELSEQAAALKDDIAAWKVEYDATSPDALRERAVADDVSAERAYELSRAASD